MALSAAPVTAQQISGELAQDLKNDPEPQGPAIGKIPVIKLRYLLAYHKCKEALALLNSVPPTRETDYVRHLWQGLCHIRCDEEDADDVPLFEKSLPLHDLSWCNRIMIARALDNAGHSAQALTILKGMPENKTLAYGFEARATCNVNVKDFDAAIVDMRTTARLNPTVRKRCLLTVAEIYVKENRFDDALKTYNELFEGPNKAPYETEIAGRGMLLKRMGRYEAAVRDFSDAIKHGAANIGSNKAAAYTATLCRLYQARAECYDKLGKPALAASDRREEGKISRSVEDELFGKGKVK